MKYSTRLSDAMHILAFIALSPESGVSSASIAQSLCTNPAYVRQLMSCLRENGLLLCRQGKATPKLARPARQISLLDVYKAVEGHKPLLHLDTHTNPDCGVGIHIQFALQGFYSDVQQAAEARMASLTLAALLADYADRTGTE